MWVVMVICDGCFGRNMGASSQIEKEREVAARRAREREREMDGWMDVLGLHGVFLTVRVGISQDLKFKTS
jgi:hypothetical protein